jgi:hypothetical protein
MLDRIRVVALLAEDDYQRFSAGLPSTWIIRRAQSVRELATAHRMPVASAVVIDPERLSPDSTEEALAFVTTIGVMPILYTTLTSANAKRILEWERRVHAHVILRGSEDEPALVRRQIETITIATVPTQVLRAVGPRLRQLPSPLMEEVVGLFSSLQVPNSPAQLFEGEGKHRRTWERYLSRAGFCNGECLLACARLARIWESVERNENVSRIAKAGGYTAIGTLRNNCKRIFGTSPSRLRTKYTTPEFVQLLTDTLTHSGLRTD